MGYEVHIVRSADWLDAAASPITQAEVDALVAADPELGWSSDSWFETRDAAGTLTRHYSIEWRGAPLLWFEEGALACKGPGEGEMVKLVRIARALGARVVGDDHETYELRKRLFGGEKLVTHPARA